MNTEQMLSDMAEQMTKAEAAARGMSVEELRKFRRNCKHHFRSKGLYDLCLKCGEGRA